jgi:hypothetical protein
MAEAQIQQLRNELDQVKEDVRLQREHFLQQLGEAAKETKRLNERLDGSNKGDDKLKFYEAKHLKPKDWKGDEAGYKDFLEEVKTYAAALSESGEELVMKAMRAKEPFSVDDEEIEFPIVRQLSRAMGLMLHNVVKGPAKKLIEGRDKK